MWPSIPGTATTTPWRPSCAARRYGHTLLRSQETQRLAEAGTQLFCYHSHQAPPTAAALLLAALERAAPKHAAADAAVRLVTLLPWQPGLVAHVAQVVAETEGVDGALLTLYSGLERRIASTMLWRMAAAYEAAAGRTDAQEALLARAVELFPLDASVWQTVGVDGG